MTSTADELLATVSAALPRLHALDEVRASVRPGPGRWSKKEILGHLIDSASNNHQRFVRMQLAPHIELEGYAQDDWVRISRHQDCSWSDLISFWESYNRFLAVLLRHVDPAARRHTWTDPDGRRVDLEFVARDYVVHIRHHLSQLDAP